MKHTLVALVEDKPGVLNRVASLFRRRNFNIESLTVAGSSAEGLSRITMVVRCEPLFVEQILKQVNKLVDVVEDEARPALVVQRGEHRLGDPAAAHQRVQPDSGVVHREAPGQPVQRLDTVAVLTDQTLDLDAGDGVGARRQARAQEAEHG